MNARAAQRALIALGYDLGPSLDDGDWGRLSRLAASAFQRGRGLAATGELTPETERALQAAIAERAESRTAPAAMLTVATLTALAKACGAKANTDVVQGIVDHQHYLAEGGIDTPARLAEFIAQACLETAYFSTLKEFGGPSYFARYDGRKDLGNVVAGDGARFPGRGIFQCTGRANYAAYGKRLGLDLIKEPALAERPDISVRIAVFYWNDKGLSAYADRGDTPAISRAINRGSAIAKLPANHESDRIRIARVARELFAA